MRSAMVQAVVPQKATASNVKSTRGAPVAVRASSENKGKNAFAAAMAAVSLATAVPAFADIGAALKLPPLDPDPKRCERGFVGNTIGQANAVSDKILDIRFCEYDNADLKAKVLSGALMSEASFKNANMQETVLSKAYAVKSNFSGADFTNAVIDRAVFNGSDMSGAKFVNAVITGADFSDVNLTEADFEDALVGNEDVKRLCQNPTVVDDTRYQIGCRD